MAAEYILIILLAVGGPDAKVAMAQRAKTFDSYSSCASYVADELARDWPDLATLPEHVNVEFICMKNYIIAI